jgi:hypothetical protein
MPMWTISLIWHGIQPLTSIFTSIPMKPDVWKRTGNSAQFCGRRLPTATRQTERRPDSRTIRAPADALANGSGCRARNCARRYCGMGPRVADDIGPHRAGNRTFWSARH